MCSVVFLGKQDTLLLQYLSSVKCINAASGFTAGDKPAMDLHPIIPSMREYTICGFMLQGYLSFCMIGH